MGLFALWGPVDTPDHHLQNLGTLIRRDAAMIHILHLCSYYTGSTVYRDLISQLARDDRIGSQFVFVPIRSDSLDQKHKVSASNVSFRYVRCLNLLTRISFSYKQLKLFFSFFRIKSTQKALRRANIIHAHTLYADGVLAYILFLRYKKPYVVTVRGTDVNLGDHFFILWRPLVRAILRNANHVFFLSPSHLKTARTRYSPELGQATVLPNGLDPSWLENAVSSKLTNNKNMLTGIYIGGMDRNKNLKAALESFHLAADGAPYRFFVIGGTQTDYEKTYGKLKPEIMNNIKFQGAIKDKAQIRNFLSESDLLLMPSFSETFGLVYLEAISQGTPVIYSSGQGIDGYFKPGQVGFPCDPNDPQSLVRAIHKVLFHFPQGLKYDSKTDNPVHKFSWPHITDELIELGYIRKTPL